MALYQPGKPACRVNKKFLLPHMQNSLENQSNDPYIFRGLEYGCILKFQL